MSTFEINGSILLIITCILITIAILFQGSKKSGISALGGQDTYFSKDGNRSTEAKLVLTAAASATAPTYDLKIDTDGSGVPDGTALLDAVPDTVGTYGSWDNVTMAGEYGVQTAYIQLASNASTSDWIGFAIMDAAGADTAGTVYITIMGQ